MDPGIRPVHRHDVVMGGEQHARRVGISSRPGEEQAVAGDPLAGQGRVYGGVGALEVGLELAKRLGVETGGILVGDGADAQCSREALGDRVRVDREGCRSGDPRELRGCERQRAHQQDRHEREEQGAEDPHRSLHRDPPLLLPVDRGRHW
jgi:hypothetical protein